MAETNRNSSIKPTELINSGVLILDMFNCFDFEGADDLEPAARAAAKCVHRLRSAFRERGWPVICVNDNLGGWHSLREDKKPEAVVIEKEAAVDVATAAPASTVKISNRERVIFPEGKLTKGFGLGADRRRRRLAWG